MSNEKSITVQPAGSGATQRVVVRPGDTPRQVLARVLEENPNATALRTGAGKRFEEDTDLFQHLEEDEKLFTATQPVVGSGG